MNGGRDRESLELIGSGGVSFDLSASVADGHIPNTSDLVSGPWLRDLGMVGHMLEIRDGLHGGE